MTRKFLTPIVLPADPAAPMEAATKQYVDGLATGGSSWKVSVRVTGGPAYNNTFMQGLDVIDGVTTVDGDRILMVGQSNAAFNGIWIAHSGSWTRATDADTAAKVLGMVVFVNEGTVYADTTWALSTNAPITFNTTSLAYRQITGDEVAISPDDPIAMLVNPNAELWYDTDAPATLTDDQRWNTAWGIVAMTNPVAMSQPTVCNTTVWTAVSPTLTFKTVPGRRYRIFYKARAVTPSTGGNSSIRMAFCPTSSPGSALLFGADDYFLQYFQYGNILFSQQFVGDGTTYVNFAAYAIPYQGSAIQVWPTEFYIEDVGPVTNSGPILTNPDARWNTAWGVVAVGSLPNGQTALTTSNTTLSVLVFSTTAGRRYRVTANWRTLEANGGAQSIIVSLQGCPGGGFNDHYNNSYATGIYGGGATNVWFFNGDGTTVSLSLIMAMVSGTGVVHTQTGPASGVYVEDVGPVAGVLPAASPIPAWNTVTYLNGWNASGLYGPLQYRMIGDIVYIRGSYKGGTGTVFTLPPGYRPPVTVTLAVLVQGGLLGYVTIAATTGDFTTAGANNNGNEFHGYFSVTA